MPLEIAANENEEKFSQFVKKGLIATAITKPGVQVGQPKPEVSKILIEEVRALGKPQFEDDGILTFAYFIACNKLE